jgi:hypothetical protein
MKFLVKLFREDTSLDPYEFIVEADTEEDAVMKVCEEHSELEDVDSIECDILLET